jgi:EpsI family protein
MFYVGSFWRDSKSDFDEKAPVSAACQPGAKTVSYLTISLVAISLLQLLFYQLQSQALDAEKSASAIPKIEQYGSWQRQAGYTQIWNPVLHQPDLTLSDNYSSNEGDVQLDIGYFHTQREGSEAVSSRNRVVSPLGETWKIISSSVIETEDFSVLETAILYSDNKLLTWQWYRLGEKATHNPYKAKLYEAYLRIFSERTDGAFITLSTPLDEDKEVARSKLSSFFNASIDEINHQLDSLQNQGR